MKSDEDVPFSRRPTVPAPPPYEPEPMSVPRSEPLAVPSHGCECGMCACADIPDSIEPAFFRFEEAA
jgi:hypothetical protein